LAASSRLRGPKGNRSGRRWFEVGDLVELRQDFLVML
jgi:hypothetical protein